MAKKKNLDPHRMQAIAWRDGEKKEIVVRCLNHPSVVAAMDEAAKANTGEMVLWGARKLRELGMAGKLNINEPPLFGDPEEVRNLKDRISDLERLLRFYRAMAKNLGLTVDEERGNYREKYDNVWVHPAM